MASYLLEQWLWEHISWIGGKHQPERKQSNLLNRLCSEMALESALRGWESRKGAGTIVGKNKQKPPKDGELNLRH